MEAEGEELVAHVVELVEALEVAVEAAGVAALVAEAGDVLNTTLMILLNIA